MDLCVPRRIEGYFAVGLFFLSWQLNTLVDGDVCSCQPYGCNPCPLPGPCTKANVALGKPASISSLYDNSTYKEKSGPACLAVNGNTNTTFMPINQFPTNPSCVHTADRDFSPYWEVDLGKEYVISSITVYGRSPADKNKLRSAKVTIDGNLCYTYANATDDSQPVIVNITCSLSLSGRRVKIYRDNLQFLTICQVQVWGQEDSNGLDGEAQYTDYTGATNERYSTDYTGSTNKTYSTDYTGATNKPYSTEQACTCSADIDKDPGSANGAGCVAGAVVGSIATCVIGFLLGILFMKLRLREQKDTPTLAASFSAPVQTAHDSSPVEESSPARPVSTDYENPTAVHITSNVYDSLKVSADDNVYTRLQSGAT